MKKPLLLLILLAFVCMVVSITYFLSSNYSYENKENYTAAILSEYNRLYSSEIIQDTTKLFAIPTKSLNYSEGMTIGQIDSIVRERYKNYEYVENKISFVELTRYVALEFVKGTPYENKVQINQEPLSDFINIYFLDKDPKNLSPNFYNNCSYIGYQNAILCDANFIEKFMLDLDSITRLYDVFVLQFNQNGAYRGSTVDTNSVKIIKKYIRENFIIWILGHEIAHAILHRGQIINEDENSLHFNLHYNNIERQADSLVTKCVSPNSPLGIRFKLLLGEFIQQEFRRLVLNKNSYRNSDIDAGEDFQISEKDSLKITIGYSQVPIMLRSLRLMNTIYENNIEINSTASYGIIDTNIYIMNSLYSDDHYSKMLSRIFVSEIKSNQSDQRLILICFVIAVGVMVFLLFIFFKNKKYIS